MYLSWNRDIIQFLNISKVVFCNMTEIISHFVLIILKEIVEPHFHYSSFGKIIITHISCRLKDLYKIER